MANYIARCRSSYFAVKCEKKFTAWLETFSEPFEVWEDEKNGERLFAISPEAGWPCQRPGCNDVLDDNYNPDAEGEYEEVDFTQELSEHLKENWVAVLQEVGYEKMRYLLGVAIAVAWTGKITMIDLRGITKQAQRKFGNEIKITGAQF